MSYLVLARKWRPQNFDDILGQEAIVQTLKNAIEQNRVAHAFLFSGPRGVGKTSLARVLAKALNCRSFDGPTTTPCGTCESCVEIAENRAVDVLEIDGASNRGIDNIRDLRETVRYLPASARTKIYIIDEVHMLTTESFNALLKTLEEPPDHVVFMFATTEPHKVLPTILSRCQRYDFHRVPAETLVGHLARICEAEDIRLPRSALEVIAREAEGGVRDSLSLLDQLASFAGEELTEEEIYKVLGVVDRALVAAMVRAALAGDPAAALAELIRADEAGYDIKQIERELLLYFRNLVVAKITERPERLMDVSPSEASELAEIAAGQSLDTLERMFGQLSRLDEELARSSRPRLLLEMTLARMATMPKLVPMEDLIARLEELEHRLREGGFASGGPPAGCAEPAGSGGNLFGKQGPGQGHGSAAPDPRASLKGAAAYLPASGDPGAAKRAVAQGGMAPGENTASAPASAAPSSTSSGPNAPSAPAETWDDFLDFVGNREPKIFALLASGVFAGREGREWRLNFSPGNIMMERLQGKRNGKAVRDLLTECFGDGHRLIIGEDKSLAEAQKPKSNRYQEDQKRRLEAMEDPVVKAVQDLLGGEIDEIKLK